jgi:hypothetical protein
MFGLGLVLGLGLYAGLALGLHLYLGLVFGIVLGVGVKAYESSEK